MLQKEIEITYKAYRAEYLIRELSRKSLLINIYLSCEILDLVLPLKKNEMYYLYCKNIKCSTVMQ